MSELFKPRLPNEKLHPSFRRIRSDPSFGEVIPIIQDWATGLLDRKGESDKFIKEFQSTFNSSMWEIYLNRTLTEIGCSIDYSVSSPDFVVKTPQGYEFNVEAVISDQPLAQSQEATSFDQEFRVRSALKLIGKLRDKVELFRETGGKRHAYSSLKHVQGRPFVVAIAPFDSDFAFTQNNELINLVLFGSVPPVSDGTDFGGQDRVHSLRKASGATVDTGIFTNDSYREISAVIFSTVGTFGKAISESKIERLFRSTRYRTIGKDNAPAKQKLWRPGTQRLQVDTLNYLIVQRWDFGDHIAGSDVRIQHSSFHQESHLDGLHIYYNPFADVPFEAAEIWPEEVTHNYYDPESEQPIHHHPDGALVSRQTFEISPVFLFRLLESYGFR